MHNTINISIKLLLQLINTKKVFLMYDIDNKDNTITNHIISNDLIRYRKSYDKFVLIETIKPQITNLTIKL